MVTDDWRQCRVMLPAPQNWLVLDLRNEDPEAWAREVAALHLAEDTPAEARDAFAMDVLWYWGVAVRLRALCAAVLAPPESAIIASYTVRELRIPPESLTVTAFRAEAARAEGPYFGEQGLTEVELPLGPALRVHRLEPTAPDSDGGSIVEGLAHYVLPRKYPTALECRLLWSTLGFGEELEKIADELAESVLLE
ncbi:hypothetical protein PV396_21150 [Streptomyces sp. ME02-8801-2C]|uniref:hypothetical protein n=1 Tax=Streptomyces sp. ME02-8801-2C TaxID=3028680 RepID=UPI0029AC82E1|nr:hypothetical protein [Streptomyces sp. ME02-8801-2C]MDX3454421.1 hypothetical protein [Streptomyces sp. ME02-8801-2C]